MYRSSDACFWTHLLPVPRPRANTPKYAAAFSESSTTSKQRFRKAWQSSQTETVQKMPPLRLPRKKGNASTLSLALLAIIVAAALVATVQLITVQRHLSTADLYSATGRNAALRPSGGGGSRPRRRSSGGRRRGGKADRAAGRPGGGGGNLPESPTEVVVTSSAAADGGPGECRCELLTLDCLDSIACIPATRESLDRSIADGLLTRSLIKVITAFAGKGSRMQGWSTQPIGKVRRQTGSRESRKKSIIILTNSWTPTNRAYNTRQSTHGTTGR